MRCSARGMPTARSISTARLLAACLPVFSCISTASRSCRPTVCTGFSEVIGSWKIMEISLPRTRRSSSGDSFRRSRSLNIASPEEIVFWRGLSPMMVMQVTLLPHPDSPTMASVLPLSTLKETPSTAPTTPSSVLNEVFRSRTSSSGTGMTDGSGEPDARIDPGVQEVDQQVDEDDDQGREDHDPHGDGVVELTERVHRDISEARHAEHILHDDRPAQGEGDVHAEHGHDGQHGVPQHVGAQDDPLRS